MNSNGNQPITLIQNPMHVFYQNVIILKYNNVQKKLFRCESLISCHGLFKYFDRLKQ
jgi:hypothetical protein